MHYFILEYYSGFNNAVSVFGGIVEKINGIKNNLIPLKNFILFCFVLFCFKIQNLKFLK